MASQLAQGRSRKDVLAHVFMVFWVFSVYLQNEWLHSLHKEDQGSMY
jgi:hypothetical protein